MMNSKVYVKKWFCQKIEAEKGARIFSFVAEVLKETEKAVYVRFENAYSYRTRSEMIESWVPKSCLYSEEEAAQFEANVKKAVEAYA